MLDMLFFIVLFVFTSYYKKGILWLCKKEEEKKNSLYQTLFSLLWVLPELLCLGVCYVGKTPQLVISSMMTSFFILIFCFALLQFIYGFFTDKKQHMIYLISIFLYMMIVLNLTLKSLNMQMLFGMKVPSILFLFLYLVSLLFHQEREPNSSVVFPNKRVWIPFFILCILLFILTNQTSPSILKMILLILIPKITGYQTCAKYKMNLFPNLFYDGTVRFYLIGVFDLLFSSGVIYDMVSSHMMELTHKMIYAILPFYFYLILKKERTKIVSLLIIGIILILTSTLFF